MHTRVDKAERGEGGRRTDARVHANRWRSVHTHMAVWNVCDAWLHTGGAGCARRVRLGLGCATRACALTQTAAYVALLTHSSKVDEKMGSKRLARPCKRSASTTKNPASRVLTTIATSAFDFLGINSDLIKKGC